MWLVVTCVKKILYEGYSVYFTCHVCRHQQVSEDISRIVQIGTMWNSLDAKVCVKKKGKMTLVCVGHLQLGTIALVFDQK